MKIQVASDIHLEFFRGKNLFVPKFLGEDILVLAGDIQVGLTQEYWFSDLLEHRDVIYVAGNHEFYNNDYTHIYVGFPLFEARVNELAEIKGYKHKFYALQNQSVEIGDIKFIAATLWTDFKKNDNIVKWQAVKGMTDYQVITNNGFRITPDFIYDEHTHSVKYIEDELNKPTDKKLFVVTHHLPSYGSVAPMYRTPRDEMFNHLYYSDLDHLVEKADFWAHGHTHESAQYDVGKCKVICNPHGYKGYGMNPNFTDVVIDV